MARNHRKELFQQAKKRLASPIKTNRGLESRDLAGQNGGISNPNQLALGFAKPSHRLHHFDLLFPDKPRLVS